MISDFMVSLGFTSCYELRVRERGKFESCESKVWLWFEEGNFFLFFFFFLYGGKFVCFEFDRPLGIVEILRVILGVSSFDLFLVNLDNLYE